MHAIHPYSFWLCAQCLAFPLWVLVCDSIILLASSLGGLSQTLCLYIYNFCPALTNDKKHPLHLSNLQSFPFISESLFSWNYFQSCLRHFRWSSISCGAGAKGELQSERASFPQLWIQMGRTFRKTLALTKEDRRAIEQSYDWRFAPSKTLSN